MKHYFAASVTFADIIYVRFDTRKDRDEYIKRMNAGTKPFEKGYSFIPNKREIKDFVDYNR